ncbi:MAG: hypothetical protein ACK48W_12200 [Bacteroidota bacterium]
MVNSSVKTKKKPNKNIPTMGRMVNLNSNDLLMGLFNIDNTYKKITSGIIIAKNSEIPLINGNNLIILVESTKNFKPL